MTVNIPEMWGDLWGRDNTILNDWWGLDAKESQLKRFQKKQIKGIDPATLAADIATLQAQREALRVSYESALVRDTWRTKNRHTLKQVYAVQKPQRTCLECGYQWRGGNECPGCGEDYMIDFAEK